MLSKAEIKFIHSLRDKKAREEQGLFVVEGEKMVSEALASSFEVQRVLRIEEIGSETMSRICSSTSAPPVIALVRMPAPPPEAAELPEGLSLALDSVRDPGNMGTIIRIADWFGVQSIFASSDSVDFFNPKVIQASMGSIFRMRLSSTDIPQLCARYRSLGLSVYGTFLNGTDIYSSSLDSSGLIVMGNESRGISNKVSEQVSVRLLIPSFGGSRAESLNVAVASAITLSEFRRRKS